MRNLEHTQTGVVEFELRFLWNVNNFSFHIRWSCFLTYILNERKEKKMYEKLNAAESPIIFLSTKWNLQSEQADVEWNVFPL